MKPMGYEANQLLRAGREAFQPTESDRVRVMGALAGAATLSVGTAVAAGAAKRSINSILTAVPAARALVFALPLAAAGAFGWHTAMRSPATKQVERAVVVPPSIATAPAAPVQPVQEVDPAEQSMPSATPVTSEPRTPAGEAPKPGAEIRQEVALLSKAQTALSRGRPLEALEALSQHAQRFPRGALSEERAATRARTLCALGRTQEAEVELSRMEKLNPGSAYLARARQSCKVR